MALSANALKAFLGRETDEVALFLITLDHASFDNPIRVVSDTKDIVSNGETFTGFPFELTIPTDNETSPMAQLNIANVDRSIGNALVGLTQALDVKMELILASDPDVIERVWDNFEMINIKIDAMSVSGQLVVRSKTAEPWPNKMVTAKSFPALIAALG